LLAQRRPAEAIRGSLEGSFNPARQARLEISYQLFNAAQVLTCQPMRNLRDRPVGQKITFVIMLISGVVLLLAFAALFCFQAYTLRQHSAHELAVVGEITAHNCAAAVMFKDEGAAAQILTGLKTMPQIVSARLEVADQQRLAYFGGLRDEMEIKAAR
jgi:hypothetical protein